MLITRKLTQHLQCTLQRLKSGKFGADFRAFRVIPTYVQVRNRVSQLTEAAELELAPKQKQKQKQNKVQMNFLSHCKCSDVTFTIYIDIFHWNESSKNFTHCKSNIHRKYIPKMKSSQIRGGSNCHITNENRSLKIFLLG